MDSAADPSFIGRKVMETYLNRQQMTERGWTDGLIRKFLGAPDKTVPNPLSHRLPPCKLYSLSNVMIKELSLDFKAAQKKAQHLSEALKASYDVKRQALLAYIRDVPVDIPDMDKEALIDDALYSYNSWHEAKAIRKGYSYIPVTRKNAPMDDSVGGLKRIVINYVRHRLTDYEDNLTKMFGKVGVQEAHDIIQKRINDAIKEKYPFLA